VALQRDHAQNMWWAPSSQVEELASSRRLVRLLALVAWLAAALAMTLGAAGLVGWAKGVQWLQRPAAGVAMVPNTALLLVLNGLSLACSVGASRRRRWAGKVLAATAAALSLTIMAQDVLGRDFGVDTLLFHVEPSRPSPPSYLAMFASSLALLVLDVRPRRWPAPAEVLAAAAAAIAWLALGGYVLHDNQFYAWGRYPHATGVSLTTTIGLLALDVGAVAARPESGAVAIFTCRHVGGQVARRMLLVALSIPVLGGTSVLVYRAGLYQASGAAIVAGVAGTIAAIAITAAVSTSLNRTDAQRRRVEEEAREWKRVFDEATFGAAIGTIDGRFAAVNEAFARMHGLTAADLEGKPIASVFRPEHHAELAERQRITHESGRARWESEHLRKDGSTFPVVIDVSSIRDERGHLLYTAAYVQDITQRKAAEETRSRLASLVMSADDAIVAEALDGTVLAWNRGAERVFGYSSGEMVGRPLAIVVPEDRRAERDAIRARAQAGEVVAGFETERVRQGGAHFPVALTLSPIRDAADRVVAFSSIKRDISALKQLERQREEWSSVVAHDLRQPSTTIRYATETIARADGEARQKAVASIRRASDRLERMIADLLDVTRVEARRLSVRLEPVSLGPLVAESIAALPEAAGRARTEIAPEASVACVDADRFLQVMSNLLSNAYKYGKPGAPVEVRVARSGEMVQVSVTNEGPGIPADELPMLFRRFGRTRASRKNHVPGLGLGLYMSRGIVEAHGGKLWAESTPGDKTYFRFTLPTTPKSKQESAT
jgi:PAS domain S-box-containing protein